MEIKQNTIIIKDPKTGKEFMVKTVRSAQYIAGNIEETENEAILEAELEQSYQQKEAVQAASFTNL